MGDMTESQKLSRRDWFRLRRPTPPSVEKSPKLVGENDEGQKLQAVELPPNYDGMNLDELPPLREAQLTTEDVHSLFEDILQLGSNILLMQRSSTSTRADAAQLKSETQLALAKDAMLSGNLQRVQIRYDWESCHWIDTISSEGTDNFRLIRVRHKQAPK